jgi:mono/diheme cytochrome c family protein
MANIDEIQENQKPGFNWRLAFGVVVGVGITAVIYFLMQPGANIPAGENTAQNNSIGKSLYETNCASCHGLQGEGHIEPNAPALDHSEHAWHHPDEQIINIIREGGFNMPPVGADMSDKEIEIIITYIKGWWSEDQKDFQQGDIGEG